MLPMYKWTGGKRSEIQYIKDLYPKNFSTFIEPFFGGGAVFFDLNFSKNVINDVHPESINFLAQIKNGYGQEIYDLMKHYNNCADDYYFIRDKFEADTDIKRAFRFYYIMKTCFRGMLRYNSKGKFNIPFGKYKTINFDNLLDNNYYELLKNTEIYNQDFNFIFDKYNDELNFVFLDPPYDSTFTDYGYCKFDREQHTQLANRFKETKNKCLLVIASTPFIDELYKDYIHSTFSKKYAFKLYAGRIGDEIDKEHLIISNYL